jgi:hypothetical protein
VDYYVYYRGLPPPHCGDFLFVISACREFIEKTGNTIYMDEYPDVVSAYNHPLFKVGSSGVQWPISVEIHRAHRIKENTGLWKPYQNIYGCALAAMGLLRGNTPTLKLPSFPAIESRIVMQPFSRFAQNPHVEFLQEVANQCRAVFRRPVCIIGKENTPRLLKGVEYCLSDKLSDLMRMVQHAALVLTPRSLCANVAAAYHVPAFVWAPDDGENWHLNYPDWKRKMYIFRYNQQYPALEPFLLPFLRDICQK